VRKNRELGMERGEVGTSEETTDPASSKKPKWEKVGQKVFPNLEMRRDLVT